MGPRFKLWFWLIPFTAVALAACGGDGSSSPPTLTSIALAPLAVTLEPDGTATLSVTGTYSDGSTKSLPASGETFSSSNSAVATVTTAGVVTAACGAAGATATISATDTASGLSTSAAMSTKITLGTTVTLCSIALQPASLSLRPNGVAQLTVVGTYSDGSTQQLTTSNETFTSSDTAVATVSAAGVVTVPAGAAAGAMSTVSARDVQSGLETAGANSTVVTISATPVLTSIALSPASLSLAPTSTAQLVVTGTYSDGSTLPLAASGESFTSSDTSVATVSASGLLTMASGAAVNATATVSATDQASGLSTSAGNSTQVTVSAIAAVGAPTMTSATAAAATAENNAQCTPIQPFYWEIGNANSALASGSPTPSGGSAVLSSSKFSIASASKWIYGMYVVQQRGGAANLTANDIKFLTFQSGYTYMGSDTSSAACTPPSSGADSINHCLTLPSSTSGEFFDSQNPQTIGVFDYDGGHEENHAGQFQPEINALDTSALGPAIASGLGVAGVTLRYNQPLLAGGIYGSADDYSPLLRAVLSGQLGMLNALGTHAVCAWSVGSGCNAAYSPVYTEHFHYSIAHWVEDDPTSGDGAFSSPGAFGFYPWIEANKHFYGVISRAAPANGTIQNGLQSSLCGHEIRAAWESGQQQ
jgi:hypothetical protein